MATCPSCNKFAGLENGDPEVNELELSVSGEVTCNIRLTRMSTCCNEEMKEANYELSYDASEELEAHVREAHPELVKGDSVQLSIFEVEEGDAEADEAGGSRYKKNMISVALSFTIHCTECPKLCKTCHKAEEDHTTGHEFVANEFVVSGEMRDELAAGQFDELC